MPIEDLLASLWERVEKGDLAALKGELERLAARKLSRAQRVRLAAIANDAHEGTIAHGLLYRTVISKGKLARATDAERLQYGRALLHLDLLTESLRVLETVDPGAEPMVGLALGWVYGRLWDYPAMVPVLRAGAEDPRVAGRNRLRYRVLLANAIFTALGERREPERLLRAAIEEARRCGYWDTEVQATNIIVAHHLWDHEWAEARRWLETYEELFKDRPGGHFALTREKWWRVLELHTSPDRGRAIAAMEDLKRRCAKAGLYSQVRNCEYYQAMCFEERELAARLYFGSPYPCFRQRVVRDCRVPETELPSHYDFVIGGERVRGAIILDATRGCVEVPRAKPLKPGQAVHRLLEALIADHYVPANIHELCARVYPEEHFNPATSPPRIAQLLLRLRRWLAQGRVPLRIEQRGGRYHLTATAPVALRVRAPWDRQDPEQALPSALREALALVRERFGAREFGAVELERAAGISRSSALGTLRALAAAGLLARSGAGNATRYRAVG